MKALIFALFVSIFSGCTTVMVPMPPSFNTAPARVQVQTQWQGKVRVACLYANVRNCWFVDNSVPDGISMVILPPAQYYVPPRVVMYPGQWQECDKNGICLFHEVVPQVTGVMIVIPTYPIGQRYPNSPARYRPCKWCKW